MTEAEHDAWLREALRHAPDAEVAPPPRLRALILREATEATNGGLAAAANPVRWFGALLDRPVWATGLASVFVAVIVALVWSPWSGAPEPAVVATGMRDLPVGAPAASQPPAANPAVLARAEPARETPREAAPAPRAAERAKSRNEAAAPPAAAPAVTAAPAAPPATAEAERRAAPQLAARSAADTSNDAAAGAAAAPRNDVPSPLIAPRRGLRTEPDMWTWQRGSQDPLPVNDALRQWLDKLEGATAGRWEPIKADPPGTRGLTTLNLLREERIHTILRIETDGVSRRGSVRLRAVIDPATASQLARELGQIAP